MRELTVGRTGDEESDLEVDVWRVPPDDDEVKVES